ncbi:sodium channel protein Nach-like [Zerene cesonia]|uniref:sodium channel protein Nach-like n=1 Tax=Zerene cesonia TaxID=33412 RepID=UPI0018E4EED4|nr:sodium channel protein Nach-like [Zerene cesonia]
MKAFNYDKANAVWWHAYRNRHSKEFYSVEMIFRQALKDTFREYADHSSISGFQQMCNPNISYKQRLIWVLGYGIMLGIMLYFLIFYIWIDCLDKPFVVTMETSTYPISLIDFPAVAICNVNRISRKALLKFAHDIHPLLAKHNESILDVLDFFRQLGSFIDFSYNESMANHNFNKPFEKLMYESNEVLHIMESLAPSCEEMLLDCVWANRKTNCTELFQVRRTSHGHCCVFNYVLDNYETGLDQAIPPKPQRQAVPGIPEGLNILVDPLVDDYAYSLYNYYGIEVFLFDSTHFPDISSGRVIHRTAQPNQRAMFNIWSTTQTASAEVRKYAPKTFFIKCDLSQMKCVFQRECYFHDECQSLNRLYSYSACIVHCRITTMMNVCRCITYLYKSMANPSDRICTFADLPCLNQIKEKLLYLYPKQPTNKVGLELELIDSLKCDDCLSDCQHTKYFSKYSKVPFDKLYPHDMMFVEYVRNMTGKIWLSVYKGSRDGVLNRLDVVSYWFEIISIVGSFYGILIGLSIICVSEIFYYFLVRFFIRLYRLCVK